MNLRKIVRKVKQNVSSGLRKGSYKTCNFSRSDSKKRRGLLPENSFPWFNLNQPCTRTSFSVRRRSVKGSNHGLLYLLDFSIRSGQSRGQTAVFLNMLCWLLLCEAVNQGVQPRSPIPSYTGFSYSGRSVKGSNRGFLYLVILNFSIRSGQSRGQAAVSYTMLYWVLVYGAVSQGVIPRSPLPCYTGL